MGIFRGPGGTGDATGDATNQASLAIAAANTATSAATSASNSANSASNSAIAAAASAATIDTSLLATLTGTETLTNKTISGSDNTLSNIGNSSLTNNSLTVNGTSIALGASDTITAVNPNTLTIGTGLSGTSYDGGSAVTVAVDSTVATLSGTQTLTNKTITFGNNTLTDVASTNTTQTLTSKTLTNPTINGFTGDTGVINIGSGQIYKDVSGNVGIGTSSPADQLVVTKNQATGTFAMVTNSTSGGEAGFGAISAGTSQSIYFGTTAFDTLSHYIYGEGNYPLSISTNATERMRITADGDINSTTLYNNTSSGGRDVQIASNGTLYSVSSSLKYKTGIETLDYELVDNAISNLRPVFYRDKEPKGDVKEGWSHIGLIAEEAAEVEPRIVHYKTVEVTFEDEEVEEGHHPRQKRIERVLDEPVPEGIDYARLSILCLAEIQKQREVIASLTARIELLENNV